MEKSGAELIEEQKEVYFVLFKVFSDVFAQFSSDFGRTSKLEHEYTLVTALQLRTFFVDSLPIIVRRCRSFCIL